MEWSCHTCNTQTLHFFVCVCLAAMFYIWFQHHIMRDWVVRDVWTPLFHTLIWMDTSLSVFSFLFFSLFCGQFFSSFLWRFLWKRYFLPSFCYLPKNGYSDEICSLHNPQSILCFVFLRHHRLLIQHERDFFQRRIFSKFFEMMKMQPL